MGQDVPAAAPAGPSASRNSPNASQPITLGFQDAWRLGLAATEYR